MPGKKKINIISLYAGGGGSTIGYSQAGLNELIAVEYHKPAADTIKKNFPKIEVICEDITKLNPVEVMRGRRVDILDGSPPCQGFSTAGKRRMDDERNNHPFVYLRWLKELKPKAFIFENVSGLAKGGMKGVLIEVVNQMRKLGYKTKVYLLNAADYGTPQTRERVYILGSLKEEPMAPSRSVKRWITAGEAIADIKNDPAEVKWLLEKAATNTGVHKYWHLMKPGENAMRYDPDGSFFSCYKYNPKKPANTVMRSDGDIGRSGALHWSEKRRFTVAEFKRFCGFPDNYILSEKYKDAVSILGNSVPPPMAKAVGLQMAKYV